MSRSVQEVLPSAARTATPASVEVSVPPNADNLELILDVTAVSATPSITPSINGVVPISGTEYDILDGPAVTGVGVTTLIVGPGASVAGESEQRPLPTRLVVDVAHADADSITYSIVAIFS